jgi:hypothetical protein
VGYQAPFVAFKHVGVFRAAMLANLQATMGDYFIAAHQPRDEL